MRFADFVGSVFSMVDISYDFAPRIYEEFVGSWVLGFGSSWVRGVGGELSIFVE